MEGKTKVQQVGKAEVVMAKGVVMGEIPRWNTVKSMIIALTIVGISLENMMGSSTLPQRTCFPLKPRLFLEGIKKQRVISLCSALVEN